VDLSDLPTYRPHQHHVNLLLFSRTAADPVKGADIAADAVRILRGRGADVRLTLIGAAPTAVREQEQLLVNATGAGRFCAAGPALDD